MTGPVMHSKKHDIVSSKDHTGSFRKTKTYFVSGGMGSDVTGDGSIMKPYQTIQKVIDETLGAGDSAVEILIDLSTTHQHVYVPSYGKVVSIFGPTADVGSMSGGYNTFHTMVGGNNFYVVGNNTNIQIDLSNGGSIGVILEGCVFADPIGPIGASTFTLHNCDVSATCVAMITGAASGSAKNISTGETVRFSQMDMQDRRITNLPSPSAGDDADTPDARDGAISSHAGDADAHHAQSHAHDGSDGSGTVSYDDLTDKPTIPPAPSQASETVSGIAELATQAEADAGTDDQRIMTPLKSAQQPEFVQAGEIVGPVTSTSGTYALAGTVTKTTTAGKYKINVCCEMLGAGVSSGGGGSFVENMCDVEVRVDGVAILRFTELCTLYGAHSGLALVDLTAASHDITFYIRRTLGGTVGVQKMRACLSKVVVS